MKYFGNFFTILMQNFVVIVQLIREIHGSSLSTTDVCPKNPTNFKPYNGLRSMTPGLSYQVYFVDLSKCFLFGLSIIALGIVTVEHQSMHQMSKIKKKKKEQSV